MQYATTYTVTARAYAGGAWGSFPVGSTCTISTPAATSLASAIDPSNCVFFANASTDYLYATQSSSSEVTYYQFRVFDGGSYDVTKTAVIQPGYRIPLSKFPGLTPSTIYNYTVRMYTKGNSWTAWDAGSCIIFTSMTYAFPKNPNVGSSEETYSDSDDAQLKKFIDENKQADKNFFSKQQAGSKFGTLKSAKSIDVYPNPVSSEQGKVMISLNSIEASLDKPVAARFFNVLGEEVASTVMTDIATEIALPANLKTGLYLLVVESGTEKVTTRINVVK